MSRRAFELIRRAGLAVAIQSRRAVSDIVRVLAQPSVPVQEAAVSVQQGLALLRAVPKGAQYPVFQEFVGISLELYKYAFACTSW